jgi:hypothetical protein
MYKAIKTWTGHVSVFRQDHSVDEAVFVKKADVTTKPYGFFIEGFKDECWRIRVTDEDGLDDPAKLRAAAFTAKEKIVVKRRSQKVMIALRAEGKAKPKRGEKRGRGSVAAPATLVFGVDGCSDGEVAGDGTRNYVIICFAILTATFAPTLYYSPTTNCMRLYRWCDCYKYTTMRDRGRGRRKRQLQ